MANPRVLSVGQCGFDHSSIARHLNKALGADVTRADTFDQALLALRSGSYTLVLVNRVTDSDGTRGVDLIRTLKADPDLAGLPVMLVSNYESAQDEAASLGALRGFGKAELGTERALAALRRAIPEGSPSS